MKLRSTIRAPSRYGGSESETPTAALLQSMRRAREQSSDVQSLDPTELGSGPSQRRPRKARPCEQTDRYHLDQTPAAFPTLDQPMPAAVGSPCPCN